MSPAQLQPLRYRRTLNIVRAPLPLPRAPGQDVMRVWAAGRMDHGRLLGLATAALAPLAPAAVLQSAVAAADLPAEERAALLDTVLRTGDPGGGGGGGQAVRLDRIRAMLQNLFSCQPTNRLRPVSAAGPRRPPGRPARPATQLGPAPARTT